ncbi:MAG: hypothetical protein ACOX52_01990 [Verrucomicrobiota bacterium]
MPIRPIRPICRNRNRNRNRDRNRNRNRFLFRLASGPHGPLQLPAGLCQHRNNTVALPGFSGPNPIPRPFDTDTDTDPDPDFPFLPLRETLPTRIRMGRVSRRERRERRERWGIGRGGMQLHRSSYQPLPCPVEKVYLKIPQKCWVQTIEPTHLHRQVENATAPSAGNSPDGDGKFWMGKRIPFRDDLHLLLQKRFGSRR